MAERKTTQSDSPVVAADQQAEREGTASGENLDQQVKDQEAQQKAELREGKSKLTGPERAAYDLQEEGVPAAARAGVARQAQTQGGFMDQMSRRSGADALEGHAVTIDLSNKGVQEAYRGVNLIRDEDHDLGEYNHVGNYGVYLEPQMRDPETGIPVTALVRLRDDTHALVTVPYEALTPAASRGR